MNHIDQEAELYALGMLDDNALARVDDHLLTCVPCTGLLGQADEAIATLVDSTQQRRPARRPPRWPLAAAAAFALAASALLTQNVVMHGALQTDGTLLATMVNSHFNHAQFQAPNGMEIPAKAIYERHGKWYEILADGTPAWHLVAVGRDGARTPVSAGFAQRGAASIAIFEGATPLRSIELEDATGHVIGSVHPVLEADLGYRPSNFPQTH
jgi:hypothetical protein